MTVLAVVVAVLTVALVARAGRHAGVAAAIVIAVLMMAEYALASSGVLVNIVSIAIASTPVFAAFGPDRLNTWVADPPYMFLPTVLVPAAVFGHALTWRKLAMETGTQRYTGATRP